MRFVKMCMRVRNYCTCTTALKINATFTFLSLSLQTRRTSINLMHARIARVLRMCISMRP